MRKLIALLAGAMMMMPLVASAITIGPNGTYVESNNSLKYYDTGASSVFLTDTDGYKDSANAFMLLELAGYAGTNKFGIYGFTQSGTTTILGNMLEVFTGSDVVSDSTTLEFNLAAGTVTNSFTKATAMIGKNFGFYISTQDGNTFYTHSVLNRDGQDHFKIYDTSDHQGRGLSQSDVVLGIEDLYGLGDKDFDDMVVGITDVAPVPEPGTMVLLGFGMFGLAIYGKRRMNKDA